MDHLMVDNQILIIVKHVFKEVAAIEILMQRIMQSYFLQINLVRDGQGFIIAQILKEKIRDYRT